MANIKINKKVRWWNIALPIATPAVALGIALPLTLPKKNSDTTNYYSVQCYADGQIISTQSVENGKYATEPSVSIEGKRVKGWVDQTGKNFNFKTSTITKDIKVTAILEDDPTQKFTITYEDDYDGKIVTTEQIVESGTLAKTYVPEHIDEVGFKGWKTVKQDGTQKAEDAPYFDFMNVPIVSNIKLYSHYRKDLTTGKYIVDPESAFNYTEAEGGVTITGISDSGKAYFQNKIFDVVIPKTIKNKPVIAIGELAFFDFDSATWSATYHFNSISLPDSIQTLAPESFAINTNLRFLNMPKNLIRIGAKCFRKCAKLADFKFYDKLQIIESEAFSGESPGSEISYIRSLEMPSSLRFIGSNAFEYNSLQTLDLSKCTKLTLDKYAFANAINLREVTLPANLTYIPEWCFYACTRLRRITIPKTVKFIECAAFSCCYRLREVNFEEDSQLLFIEESGFEYCYSLDKINFRAEIKSIGYCCFVECYNLTEVTFEKDRVWYAGNDSWNPTKCTPLENGQKLWTHSEDKIEVEPDTVGDIKYLTDDNNQCYVVGGDATSGKLSIPNTVTINNSTYNVVGIGAGAFQDKTTITSVEFAENSPLKYIYEKAFAGCTSIETISFQNCKNLTYIADYAFYNAFAGDQNESIDIDFSGLPLTYIGNFAFSFSESPYCNLDGKIGSVKLPNALTYLGNGAFYKQKNITTFNFFETSGTSNLTDIGNDKDSLISYPIISPTADISLDMSNCTKLKYLPSNAFQGVTALTSIDLPSNLEAIYDCAFDGCTGLTSITIPSTCYYIGYDAFDGTGLTSATFLDTTLTDWTVTKGSIIDTCDVSEAISGKSLELSNADRLKTIYNKYSWLKITA